MPSTSPRRHRGLPLAGHLAALAAGSMLVPVTAGANDRDLRGTPVPAAACIEYRRTGTIGAPWKAGYFELTGDGQYLQLRYPLPVNNVELSAKTDDNDISKMRVHYRDSDGFGGGAGVQVVVGRSFVTVSGNAQFEAVCFWASNAHGTGGTSAAKASRTCVHDVAADSLYHVDVSMGVVAGHSAQFLGVDFPP